jgi:hypothetical protein
MTTLPASTPDTGVATALLEREIFHHRGDEEQNEESNWSGTELCSWLLVIFPDFPLCLFSVV